ncbi:MAG: anti-sigma factor [Beijerinckiaceae bacterium]
MDHADELLLQAAIDGEMDAPTLAAFEQRMESEPELAKAYTRLRALRGALRTMPAPRPPDALRERIAALGEAQPQAQSQNARAPSRIAAWRALAASFVVFGIGLAAGWNFAPRNADVEREALDGHLRGMISMRPVDVVSTDRHTVKPWFAGKLSVAPLVPDLGAQGYKLEGGRIDVISGQPAPTLVYAAGNHLVSVTRAPSQSVALPAATRRVLDGYSVLRWNEGDVAYIATSDATMNELEAFVAVFRKASEGGA